MLTISLTSIPPRFAGLGAVLVALLAQDAVSEVRLTLPRSYPRFPGPFELPDLPEGVRLARVEQDLGPATKLLPALTQTQGPVLICDDDWLYDPGWAAGFLAAARANPGAAIAASSFDAARIGVGSGVIVQGFAGVLVTPAMVPDAIFDLPDRFRSVDDIWLSGMLAVAGTPAVTVPALRDLCCPSGNDAAALQDVDDRARLNKDCATWMATTYGIWD